MLEQYTHAGAMRAICEDHDDAMADLSRAAVAWGRRLAGLPPLGT